MAIELPDGLVWVMDLLGLNWPQVNEDKVREFAGHVREFAANLEKSHGAASDSIKAMGEHYQAASYDQLVEQWSQMSSSHMTELVDVCNTAASVLDIAAVAIVGAKMAVIAELIVMAAEFIADQVAAVFTFGLAEAAEVALIAATKKIVDVILKEVEQRIIGELVEQATQPLQQAVEKAVSGLVFKGAEKALGVASGGGAGSGYTIHPDELLTHASKFKSHAEDVAGHAAKFATATEGMSFS
ncbi:hypothetical protein [Streptomyces natalensis]|uniref:Outer membrane channel protein CpnT-like N-terminal domain-containing protein n=1 Tax=Streptomyces natalensis ATCC 27448 TaxID=1240678 RepID=A0A0D7CPQ9_9ACTN|nr:hypothetical protein [Streptomyces natalensis]KIZ18056.1 hypothetical protein SNA_10350 [Streptomyces natalensis ATCC 27448]